MPTPPVRNTPAVADALAYYESWLGFRQHYLRVPGVQAAVYVDDGVALSAAHGRADVEAGAPLTPQHLFRIASHSKTFTATATFRLAERGLLRLDDTAGSWLDELAAAESPLAAATVRELLTHTAGVARDGADGDFWQLWRPFPDRAALRQIARSPGTAVIGRNERFKYSNIAFGLLGLILEQASGLEYGDLLRRDVLDPLGLSDTGAELDPARAAEYAVGYSSLGYADHRVPIEHVDTGALAAATGFYSTASDLVTYFAGHFHGDDRLLSDDSKRQLQHPMWRVGDSDKQYAHGLAVASVGDRAMIGHGGGYPGHITSSVADPVARLAVSVLTNAIDGPAEPLAHAGVRLIDLALAHENDTARADLERFTGRFASLWGVCDVVRLGDRLYLVRPEQADPVEDVIHLDVVDDTTLRIAETSGYSSYGEPISYDFADDGAVRSVRGPSATTLTPIEIFELPVTVRAPSAT